MIQMSIKKIVFSTFSLILWLCFAVPIEAKIFDCFMFFNEFDVLSIRLYELYDQVDYFVLVESDTTFQGNRKPLLFDENKEKFAPYLDKIIYVPVRDMPITQNPWERETHQRNAIMRGLKNCQKTDVIIISDADEVPSREAVEKLRERYLPSYSKPVVMEIDFRTFWFNVRHTDPGLVRAAIPVVCRYEQLIRSTPQIMRDRRGGYEVWKNCGWHFNNCGGDNAVDFYLTKVMSFSHAECNTGMPDIPALERTIDQYGDRVEASASYPHLVLENWDYYLSRKYIKP